MGEVWEGRDSRLDRRVAIKVSREQAGGVSAYRSRYDVSKDGKRFLVFTQTNRTAPTGITTVLNWTAGLKR